MEAYIFILLGLVIGSIGYVVNKLVDKSMDGFHNNVYVFAKKNAFNTVITVLYALSGIVIFLIGIAIFIKGVMYI